MCKVKLLLLGLAAVGLLSFYLISTKTATLSNEESVFLSFDQWKDTFYVPSEDEDITSYRRQVFKNNQKKIRKLNA